jgi:acetyl esterase
MLHQQRIDEDRMAKLHPQALGVLKAMALVGVRPLETLTPREARAQCEATALARRAGTLPVAKVETVVIPGPGGPLRVRLYWPEVAPPVPAILCYHDGGHVMGSLETLDAMARNLCSATGALVASVDYRLAPEHPFPAAVEDSFAALCWVRDQASSLGVDPQRLGLHGDSAGGNLAAVVALLARGTGAPALRLQSLVCPITDYAMTGESFDRYAEGHGILTRAAVQWFARHYLQDNQDVADWRISPIRAASHTGLPPAIIITAEADVLHDDGERYAAALRHAGVPVEYHDFAGMIHGFFGMAPSMDAAMDAQRLVWAAFQRAFA